MAMGQTIYHNPRFRESVESMFSTGKGFREIAKALGVDPKTVKRAHNAALHSEHRAESKTVGEVTDEAFESMFSFSKG